MACFTSSYADGERDFKTLRIVSIDPWWIGKVVARPWSPSTSITAVQPTVGNQISRVIAHSVWSPRFSIKLILCGVMTSEDIYYFQSPLDAGLCR